MVKRYVSREALIAARLGWEYFLQWTKWERPGRKPSTNRRYFSRVRELLRKRTEHKWLVKKLKARNAKRDLRVKPWKGRPKTPKHLLPAPSHRFLDQFKRRVKRGWLITTVFASESPDVYSVRTQWYPKRSIKLAMKHHASEFNEKMENAPDEYLPTWGDIVVVRMARVKRPKTAQLGMQYTIEDMYTVTDPPLRPRRKGWW